MKQNLSLVPITLLLIISYYSIASTARLHPHHHQAKVQLPKQTNDNDGINHVDPSSLKDQNDALLINDHEMELKAYVCDGKDDEEDCRVKRRMVAEAHLDYIYTQGINNSNSQGVP